MRKFKRAISGFFCVAVLAVATTPLFAANDVSEGKKLALEFCVACHQFTGTTQAGSLGPPLLVMKDRFPDRKRIYSIIYDPAVAIRPHTMMPPFGRNRLLDSDEINRIIDFLYSL